MKIYNISEIPEGLRPMDYDAYLLSGYTAGYEAGYDSIPCYKNMYFTIEAMEAGNIPVPSGAKWRVNEGEWQGPFESGTMVPVEVGDKIEISRVRNTADYMFSYKTGMPRYKAYGNAMSLVWGDDFRGKTAFPSQGGFGAMVALFESTKIVYADNLVLPATDVPTGGYEYMFNNCSLLVAAPELPATGMSESCYLAMFTNCTSLTTAPSILPAMTMANGCYQVMFSECSSLVNAPELPATNLAEFCYESMFANCTSLESAPELPAMTLAISCYSNMFQGCTSLVDAPELPATNLAPECYRGMFYGCTSLETAPELPATTLTDHGYATMFGNCSSLKKAPELPATTLDENCYRFMFQNCTSLTDGPSSIPASTIPRNACPSMFVGCTSLTKAPALPATTMGDSCYAFMFNGCTSLVNAPALPATSMAQYCFHGMFSGCTSLENAQFTIPATTMVNNCCESMFFGCTALVNAPVLQATTLGDNCYKNMFKGCTSLVNAPALPATTLATGCYYGMFARCSQLTVVPGVLPAMTLASGCYDSMFDNCTSLVTAPELPAETLVDTCYEYMFYKCSSLNYVKVLATNISASMATTNWLRNVAPTGTFIHPCGVDWAKNSNSGIPSGWTEVDDCHDYSLDHTTMEIMTGGTIQFGKAVADAPDVVLDYSLDSGSTWTTITSSTSPYVIQVQAGDVLMFRGDNPHGLGDYIGGSSSSNNTFSGSTAYFKVYGNIMSLISRTGFHEITVAPSDRGVFSWLFMGTNVVEAKNLVLPAASGDMCFNRMFANCEFITESPVIPNQSATGISTYFAMFSGCTSLNKVTALMTNLGTNGTTSWMDGVAQTGTFIKNPNMNSWSSGASGIPTGWTIVNAT